MAGGTNSKISKQNKQVKSQFKYDRQFRDYQIKENQARFDKAVLDRELQQASYDQQAKYKDKIKVQDYNYQKRLQEKQFNLDKKVYKQGLKDYRTQTELNSMSGALARESAKRAKEEALISKNFDLQDQRFDYKEDKRNLKFDRKDQQLNFRESKANIVQDKKLLANKDAFANETDRINQAEIVSKQKFATDDDVLNQEEITNEEFFVDDAYLEEDKKLDYTKDKLDKDITFLKNKAGWDVEAAQRTYEKAQVPNFNQRIDALIAREKAEGSARSAGREGRSAEREITSAIAEYGRTQAKLVDDLVFAKEDKDLTDTTISGTKTYQTELKGKDKDIVDADKEIALLTKDRKLDKLDINSRKLSLALTQNLAELGYSSERSTAQKTKTNADVLAETNKLNTKQKYLKKRNNLAGRRFDTKEKFLDKRNELNKSKIKTTFDSAKAQFKADKNKIKLDEYSANLAAQGQIPQRPKKPIPLPKPLATPRTQLAMPFAPSKTPRPVKGALGKTSVWNDVGDVANVGLQVAGLFL